MSQLSVLIDSLIKEYTGLPTEDCPDDLRFMKYDDIIVELNLPT